MIQSLQDKLEAGQGNVHVERAGGSSGRSTFKQLAFCYPLKLMPPRISSSGAKLGTSILCLYMLTYGGGLVAGDKVDLEIKVDTQCHLVLLTQGNTKVFKDRPGGSYGVQSGTVTSASSTEASTSGTSKPITGSSSRTHQRMRATIQPNASLLVLPAPVACFKDASYSQHQSFNLEDSTTSSLLLLDWFTSGRQSRGEKWHFERYRSRNEIIVAGRVIVNDVLLLEGNDFASRMGNYACYCNLFISGLPMKPILEHFKKLSDETIQYNRVLPEDLIWSFSELEKDHTAVVRCAGVETEMIKEWLAKHLFTLQTLVGRDIYKAAFA